MMQYREPINVRDVVYELRRLWLIPAVAAIVFAALFVALKSGSSALYEQRVDVVGRDTQGFADAVGAPDIFEKFEADIVARREQSKLDLVNGQTGGSNKVRVEGSAVTNTLSVFATADTAERAKNAAQSYAGQIVDAQRAAATERVVATRTRLQSELASLDEQLGSTTAAADPDRIVLLVERTTVTRLLVGLDALDQGGGGGVHDPQLVGAPDKLSRSSLGTYGILGAVLGLVLGSAFVIVKRLSSSVVYAEPDLMRYGSSVPVLADFSPADRSAKGVMASLALACVQTDPDRERGVLLAAVDPNGVPDALSGGVLDALPSLGIDSANVPAEAFLSGSPESRDVEVPLVVNNEGVRESSSVIAVGARLSSTVLVVRRRKTSILATLEAIDLLRQGGAELRGVVIVD
jgi:hypothetical protein